MHTPMEGRSTVENTNLLIADSAVVFIDLLCEAYECNNITRAGIIRKALDKQLAALRAFVARETK